MKALRERLATAKARVNRAADQARLISKIDENAAVPGGFPKGPIPGSRMQLREFINLHTTKHTTGDGGYGVAMASQPTTAKSRGEKQRLCYTLHRKHGCKFSLIYENTVQGWVLVNYKPHCDEDGRPSENQHSHDLMLSHAEVMATSVGHHVPKDLAAIAVGMSKTCSIKLIDATLKQVAMDEGLPVTWTYDYLRNHFGVTGRQGNIECNNLHDILDERRRSSGLQFFLRADESNVIDRIFIEIDGGMQTWARGGTENVVLFDPTWGTNKEGYKLCCFTTVGSTGQSEVIAAAILAKETCSMFEWAFRCFHAVFKKSPRCIFTDGDGEIARAIALMGSSTIAELDGLAAAAWGGIHHNLCVYHLAQNFFKHIKPIFGTNIEGWHKACNAFWRLAKETDTSSMHSLNNQFAELVAFIDKSTNASNAKQNSLKWLETLRERKFQWCARYVWNVCTWGLHSTQRAESLHGCLKATLPRLLTIPELLEAIDKYNEQSRESRLLKQEILRIKQGTAAGLCALVVSGASFDPLCSQVTLGTATAGSVIFF